MTVASTNEPTRRDRPGLALAIFAIFVSLISGCMVGFVARWLLPDWVPFCEQSGFSYPSPYGQPDGKLYEAIVTEENCGALSEFQTAVVIREETLLDWPDLLREQRAVFVTNLNGPSIGLEWRNRSTLVISYPMSSYVDIQHQQDRWRHFTIIYEDSTDDEGKAGSKSQTSIGYPLPPGNQ